MPPGIRIDAGGGFVQDYDLKMILIKSEVGSGAQKVYFGVADDRDSNGQFPLLASAEVLGESVGLVPQIYVFEGSLHFEVFYVRRDALR